MKKIASKGEIKKVMFIKEIYSLEVRKSPAIEGYELEPYIVTINGGEENFQYSGGSFYLDQPNKELCIEQMEEHKRVVKIMEDEGKTEEEIKEFIKGKGTEFIDRVEYLIECDIDLAKKVNLYISMI